MGLPVPELDDRTFDDLVKEARSLISRYAPEWTDHNVHDPGMTFIELFAWLAEMQIYQLNRVTDANYRKFLKLVDSYPFDVRPARVDITFENVTEVKIIEAGTQFITDVDAEKIIFETEEDFILIPAKLKSIISNYDSRIVDNTRYIEKEDIYFAAFGEKAPQGATLNLGFEEPLPEEEINISIVLFEEDLPSLGCHGDEEEQVFPSVSVIWEYLSNGKWNALDIKKDTTSALTRSGRVVLIGPHDMKDKDNLYWIRCRVKEGSYDIVPIVSMIFLNTISAVQIETIDDENLGKGGGYPEYKLSLKKIPVIRGSQKIQVEGEVWDEKDDFESSCPDDHHYMFDPEKGEITFGNGLNGSIPLELQDIRASYKTTLGLKGNVPEARRWVINKPGFDSIPEKNLREATGGKGAESIETAKTRAKKDCRTIYRAITSNDFELLALSTPGLRVARAKALPNYNPSYPCIAIPGTVTVIVVPFARTETFPPVPGDGFCRTVLNHLDKHRLVTTNVFVIGPEYVRISVDCTVHIKKGCSSIETEKRIQKTLEMFLHPLEGGLDGKGWPFGRAVFPSEIYQIIDKDDGVDYVTGVSLSADGQYKKGVAIEIPPNALVYSGEHRLEII